MPSYVLSELERNAALSLNAEYRFHHCVTKINASQTLWMLCDAEGPLLWQDDEESVLGLWPHEDYAQHWADQAQITATPKAITLPVWLSHWTAALTEQAIVLAIFPQGEQECLLISPADWAEEFAATGA